MPELGYKPVNKYLPPRPRRDATSAPKAAAEPIGTPGNNAVEKLFAWADKVLSR
jgi:hypothetical protein